MPRAAVEGLTLEYIDEGDGEAGSSHPWGPLTIADQAQHCHALMRDRAHLVGHSSSALPGAVAQVVADAPTFFERQALEGATHLLHLQQPQAMAEALAGFPARRPLEARA